MRKIFKSPNFNSELEVIIDFLPVKENPFKEKQDQPTEVSYLVNNLLVAKRSFITEEALLEELAYLELSYEIYLKEGDAKQKELSFEAKIKNLGYARPEQEDGGESGSDTSS